MNTHAFEELQALCAVWQERLRLQDWDVTVSLKRHREMSLRDSHACCEWQLLKRRALIQIEAPEDALQANDWAHSATDHELSLVHELLHLHFAPFSAKTGTAKDTAQELAIHRISLALVAAYRVGAAVKPHASPT